MATVHTIEELQALLGEYDSRDMEIWIGLPSGQSMVALLNVKGGCPQPGLAGRIRDFVYLAGGWAFFRYQVHNTHCHP